MKNLFLVIFISFFHIAQLFAQNNYPAKSNSSSEYWESIGPTGVGYNAKLIFDTLSTRLYCVEGNSVFKSEDYGNSWINISPDYIADNGNSELVISPANSNELYFIYKDKGTIYKSTNAGKDWELYFAGPGLNIIFLNKNNPDILIALRPTGGWGNFLQIPIKSTDRGNTWFQITNGIDIAKGPIEAWVNPYHPDIILANQMITYGGDASAGNNIYKTTDGGESWNEMKLDSDLSFSSFLFDPSNRKIMYLNDYRKPWLKTSDGGNTWIKIGEGLPDEAFYLIFISPFNSDLLYAASPENLPDDTSIVYKSVNGGITWVKYSTISSIRQIISLIIDPENHNEIFIATYPNGIFRSTGSGQNWIRKSNGLNRSEVCSVSPATAEIIYAGIGSAGLFRTTDGGKNWDLIHKNLASCPGQIFVSKTNPLTIFTNDYFAGFKFSASNNGGDNWQNYPCSYNGFNTFDVASDNGTIYGNVFLGDNNGHLIGRMIKSGNGGSNWQMLNLNINDVNNIYKIKIDPYNKDIVYALIWIRGIVSRNSIIKSTDGGNKWEIIVDDGENFFLNEGDSRYIYYTGNNNLFISNNRGEYFEKISTSYNIKSIAGGNFSSNELFALTNEGNILKSTDYGYNWDIIEQLRRDAGIQDLQVCYSDSGIAVLLGSTQNNGILKYDFGNKLDGGDSGFPENISFYLSQNYPNPFNPITNFGFRIADFGLVTLKVFDILGNEVATLVNEEKQAGEYKVVLNGRNLSSGVYFYVLNSGGKLLSRKMTLIK